MTIQPRDIAVVLCLLGAGCGTGLPNPFAPGPPPAPRDTVQQDIYRVQIGDTLSVRLYQTPELNEDVTVRPDGRITTTLAQSVRAAGLTPDEVAFSLKQSYNLELKDPQITVGVKEYAPVRVYVAGEVFSPGELTTPGPPPSLLQAISRAGGVRVTGDTQGMLIVRRGADNRPLVYAAHYADAVSGRDPGADVMLRPYDVVIVPRTAIADAYVWVNQHVQQFVPVSWGFSYNVNPLVK